MSRIPYVLAAIDVFNKYEFSHSKCRIDSWKLDIYMDIITEEYIIVFSTNLWFSTILSLIHLIYHKIAYSTVFTHLNKQELEILQLSDIMKIITITVTNSVII